MLVTRRAGPLLEGLWEPPGVDLEPGMVARRPLARELARLGMRARLSPTGQTLRHTITHRAIEVEVWRAIPIESAAPSAALRFVDPGTRQVPLTALARKLAALRGSL